MAETTSESGGRLATRIVLFALLIVALAALLYDRYVAKTALENAADRVEQRNQEILAQPDKVMVKADVQEAVGKPPAREFTAGVNDQYTIEEYRWRRGLPFLYYRLYAIYTGDKGDRYTGMYLNELPDDFSGEPGFLPEAVERAELQSEEAGEEAEEAEEEAEEGEGPPRRRPLEFSELDANQDGKLDAQELETRPERFRAWLMERVDTNQDGAISRQEWDNRPRRPRGGGPGGPGRPGGPPERSEPEAARGPESPAEPPAAETPTQPAEPPKPEAAQQQAPEAQQKPEAAQQETPAVEQKPEGAKQEAAETEKKPEGEQPKGSAAEQKPEGQS